ncbi:MAG: RDD family protein, partial [Hamadaea sp.]|nr:RDD family protein [Hamadaea sp.]
MTTGGESPHEGLVSGEAVHLEIRVARAGSRALALVIDILSQVATFFLLWIAVGVVAAVTGFWDAALSGTAWVVIVVVAFVAHQAVWETLTAGRTPGKLAMGLRVVRDDGGPIRFRHAVVRALIGAVVEWPGLLMPLITWAASLVTMATNSQSKRLGDLAAGTLVIHERSPAGWGWIPITPAPLVTWAATLDLTGLDDELALAVRHFLARSRQLKEPFRTRLGMRLAGEVLARTTPPPPPNTPGWAYLAAVLGERHRRAANRLSTTRITHAALWPELFQPVPAQQSWTSAAPWP